MTISFFKDTSSCEWMSYFASTGDCYLLASCNDVDFIREGGKKRHISFGKLFCGKTAEYIFYS